MKVEEFAVFQNEFEEFHQRFAKVYARPATRVQGAKYLRGLLSQVERKNAWQMAEALGDKDPDKTQRLMFLSVWKADAARDLLQKYVIDEMYDEDAIWILDETGFLKKGMKSAGVSRQYSGTAGKIDNCQIGTFLAYASALGCVLIDRRLYLPKVWADDKNRRQEANIPDAVEFETKPTQAVQMLQHALKCGVPMRWVTGDEVYGNTSALRDAIANAGKEYVLAVSSSTLVQPVEPEMLEKRAPLDAAKEATWVVSEVLQAVKQWERLSVSAGEKGPIIYDWAVIQIHEQVAGERGRAGWLLIRRSVSNPSEVAYYLSNAQINTSASTLARVASARYKVEMAFEQAKGETGLDHYEVRHHHSWYRHITLSMMALAFLVVMRGRVIQASQGAVQKKRAR